MTDKELITELADRLVEYSLEYEIIDNPELSWIDEKDDTYLNFPYAVKFTLYGSERFVDYSVILNVNESRDGLEFWYEDYPISVDNPEWFFIGYANALEAQRVSDKYKIEKLEQELSNLKSESEYKIRKLEDRIIELGS